MGLRNFILKRILLWTIHDFLGYGIVVGVAHQGYVACPICGPNFKGEHSVELGKHTYTQTRRWLTEGHPYKLARMKDHFDGQIETRNKPINVTTEEQLAQAMEYQDWLNTGNNYNGVGDPSKEHGVKHRSVLYDLPYWKVNMHTC